MGERRQWRADVWTSTMMHGRKIAVIGLGYVGLPVAVSFARSGVPVVGFGSFGTITSTRAGIDMRELQFSLKLIVFVSRVQRAVNIGL